MRTIKNLLWALLPIFALTLVVGCEKGGDKTQEPAPEPEPGPVIIKDSEIKLTLDEDNAFSASFAGGTYVVQYEIVNPHAGEKISAEASEGWVNNFNYGITGALGFTVDANSGTEGRECLVTVKYRYAEDVVFVVKQGAKVGAGFTIENVVSDYFSYTVDVIPENKTQPYIVMSADPIYILQSGFETGEDYYEDDYAYFGYVGSFYGDTAVDIMQIRAKIGDQRGITVSNGASGVPYTFYMYYFDWETGALASDVTMFTITTKTPDYISASFDAQYTVDGTVVTADVTPQGGFQGAYYFDMLNSNLVDSYIESLDFINTPADAVKFYWSNAVQEMMRDMSNDQIVSFYNCQGTYPDGTPRSHFEFELLANHKYYLFAFAMDEHGLCCSEPTIVEVMTGDVEMSDNVITPSVSNITVQTAYISFETTNDDFYIAGWEKASDWATFGTTDAERQQYLLENRSYEFISGSYSQNVIGLEPGTDYVLYAFGSRGGVATTEQIFVCEFSTRSSDAGSATVEIINNGYFLASDIALLPGYESFGSDYYSGKLIFPLEYNIQGEWSAFWCQPYVWTGRYDRYNDKQYLDGLVWSINEYGSMNTDKSYTILEADGEYVFVAMVIDTEGYYSELAKLEVNTSYDNARTDAEWYAEWWEDKGPSLSSLVIGDEPMRELFRTKENHTNKLSKSGFEIKPSRMEM